MTKELNEVFKCSVCGNIVTVLHVGGGTLVCCNKEMIKLTENTVDAALEKHVPVIERTETGIRVRIGAVEHPMIPEHFIEWIEVIADGERHIRFLKPGDKPEAEFAVTAETVIAREYCNLHGLWKA